MRALSFIILLLMAIFMVIISGLLIGAGFAAPIIFVVLMFVVLAWLINAFGLAPFKDGATGFFWCAMLISLLTCWFDLFSPIRFSGVADLGLMAATPALLLSTPRALSESRVGYLILGLFIVAVLFGLLSTAASAFTNAKAAIYQLAYNAKWPLMLMLGFRVGWPVGMDRKLAIVMTCFAGIAIVFIVFQNISPDAYRAFGRNVTEGIRSPNPLVGGLLFRATGPFIHSSVLAFFSALFMAFAWILTIQSSSKKRLVYGALMCILFVLLVLSGQKQEMSAALAAVGLLAMALKIRYPLPAFLMAVTTALVLVTVLGVILGKEVLDDLGEQWGLLPTFDALKSARPVLVGDSFTLANQYFPLGSGLGTFAGIGAKLFNRDLYSHLGYIVYWWYIRDIFLLDTYWPNYIAELGWIGFSSLICIPFILISYSWFKIVATREPSHKKLWAYAFAGQFVPFVISLTSPIYSNPQIVGFAMMLFGMASMYGKLGKQVEVVAVKDSAIANPYLREETFKSFAR